jgi:hypothetical protein|tara:strand:+ start:5758 stop:7047 length:1290 start_codon:yes stop_codon:yes gene_type:complete
MRRRRWKAHDGRTRARGLGRDADERQTVAMPAVVMATTTVSSCFASSASKSASTSRRGMVVPRRIGRGRSAARPPPRASTESEGEAEDDETAKRVDAASAVLDAIIRETVQGIFVEEAATEVLNEASEAEHRETPAETVDKRAVLRSVVQSHFEELDGSFLAALGAYVRASEASGDLQLVSLLNAIKEETLATVTDSFTDEIKVVQLVARLKSNEERFEVIRTAHRGGGRVLGDVEVPAVSVEKIERAAAQLVDELELQEQIPNWDLLYQVIIVRETARQLSKHVDETGVYSETVLSGSFAPSELPKAESTLIKELVTVNTVAQRRALLAKILDETKEKLDQEAQDAHGSDGKIKLKATTRGFQPRIERASNVTGLDTRDLRPGRFIDSVINLRASLIRESSDSKPVIARLGEIYYEACDVVMENANVG